ncbi:MAG: hypothetical protein WB643_12930 [Candidatus Bathyarchaeia archaeon]
MASVIDIYGRVAISLVDNWPYFTGKFQRSITEPEIRRQIAILLHIVKQGPQNEYDIRRDKRLRKYGSDGSLRNATKALWLEDSLDEDRKEPRTRGRTGTSAYYKLGFNGLAFLIAHLWDEDMDDLIKDFGLGDSNFLFRDLMKKYGNLLSEIFQLWPAIVEAGVEDIAQKRLRRIFSEVDVHNLPTPEPYIGEARQRILTSFLNLELEHQMFVRRCNTANLPYLEADWTPVNEAQERWLNAVRGNTLLRDATESLVRRLALEHVVNAEGTLLKIGLKKASMGFRVSYEIREGGSFDIGVEPYDDL